MRETNPNGTLNSYVVKPDETKAHDRYGYKMIAVIYEEPFWCCYIGLTHWSDQYTADHGDKVKKHIAEEMFPSIALGRVYNE